MEKIALDLDNVLVGLIDSFIDFCREKLKVNIRKEDITDFDISKINKELARIISGEYRDYFLEIAMNAKPLPYAREAIEELKKNYNLLVVTARPRTFRDETLKWIETYFPNAFEGVYFNDRKEEFCKEKGINIIVEDSLEMAIKCSEKGIKVYLIDQPWNRKDTINGIVRIYSWKELLKYLTFPSTNTSWS